ncbi:MAG: NifU family protein [Gemmataceae bacterium]|nr:NifU family protein [Gemmataceae bacterium]MDW8242140.1 NifU family protein [Thermogemmata sp.]
MSSLRERVEQTLRQEIAPALDLDGSTIEVVDVSNGIAQVRLGMLCSSCSGSIMTVVALLEDGLRKKIPEVEALEVVG